MGKEKQSSDVALPPLRRNERRSIWRGDKATPLLLLLLLLLLCSENFPTDRREKGGREGGLQFPQIRRCSWRELFSSLPVKGEEGGRVVPIPFSPTLNRNLTLSYSAATVCKGGSRKKGEASINPANLKRCNDVFFHFVLLPRSSLNSHLLIFPSLFSPWARQLN